MIRNNYIAEKLKQGETVQWRPHGNSMTPRLKSGDLVIVKPCTIEELQIGDIAYCKVKGNYYLHLVTKIGNDGRVLISNNHGYDNGWTKIIYGKLVN